MEATIDRGRLAARMADEMAQLEAAHLRSKAHFERAARSLLGGVPMSWMVKWAGPHPVFVEEATGAHFRRGDGHDYVDFCLGDTGAMTGHSPEEAVAGIAAQLVRGITTMLHGEVAIEVGEELQRRFGLAFWQFLLTPFHNMAPKSPATTKSDVDHHTAAFREAVRSLVEG